MAKTQVLVVENGRIVAEDIQRCLDNFGYSVLAIAFSGGEAVKK